jgi:lauroyl/myristoyl acyltransferase
MYCPWIRIEQDTQPCPATKANVRRELLSTLQVSRIKAGVKESGESAPARSVVAAADEGKDCGASPFQRQPTITLNTVDFGHDENWIRRLSPDDLINHSGNFYPYYYLNLLSILGDKEPVEKIRGLAVESTRATLLGVREYLSSLSGLPQLAAAATEAAPATNELITLSGWDTDLIRSLLARRKGLILCSHHLGPFMKLPHELALMGFNVSLVIDDITYRESVPRLTLVKSKLQKPLADAGDLAGRPAAENIHLLNIINAQDKDGFVLLLKALERGESLFVYVDGNTGWDGVWGNSSKAAIDFLGFPIAVKNGIPRLAAASGAPILPLITLNRGSERAEVVFGDPIEAPRPMSPEQRDAFVLDSMKSIYKLLEDRALTFIEQWTSSCFLHRWRIPPDSGKQEAPTDAEVGEIESLLRTGKSLRINPTRIAGLNVENSAALVDARTLRVYRAPEGARDVFLHLLEEGGLNAVQMDLLNGRNRDILTMIAHLKKLEVIVSN